MFVKEMNESSALLHKQILSLLEPIEIKKLSFQDKRFLSLTEQLKAVIQTQSLDTISEKYFYEKYWESYETLRKDIQGNHKKGGRNQTNLVNKKDNVTHHTDLLDICFEPDLAKYEKNHASTRSTFKDACKIFLENEIGLRAVDQHTPGSNVDSETIGPGRVLCCQEIVESLQRGTQALLDNEAGAGSAGIYGSHLSQRCVEFDR
jgi:hypothetical protein